jgi:hypothetical protein
MVQTRKRNLKVDGHAPHLQQVFAAVRQRGVREEHLEPITLRVMEQAAAAFANWPVVAV